MLGGLGFRVWAVSVSLAKARASRVLNRCLVLRSWPRPQGCKDVTTTAATRNPQMPTPTPPKRRTPYLTRICRPERRWPRTIGASKRRRTSFRKPSAACKAHLWLSQSPGFRVFTHRPQRTYPFFEGLKKMEINGRNPKKRGSYIRVQVRWKI